MTYAAAQGTRGDWRDHHGIIAPTGWTPEQYASYADWLLSFQLRPWDWVCECYPWMEEGSGLTIPEVWQRSWLMTLQSDLQAQGMVNGNQVIRMAVAAGRGVGKTALVAWAIHWFMSVFPNGTAVITAGTAAQLETKTWRELLKWQSLACNGWMFEWTATRYRQREAANQWYAAAIPWSDNNPQAFAGTHEKYVLMLFDEASAISPLIWEMVEGTLSTGLCFFFVYGNPSEGSGGFWEAFNGRGANRWHHFRVDAREVTFANRDEIQSWIDTWGPDSDLVRIHVLGMFPRQAATSFIDGKIVSLAAARVIEWRDIPRAIPRVMGVDIARQGMDLNVIVRRQGRKVAPDIQAWHERDTMATANYIARTINEWRPDRVFIDGVGVGAGVVDYLKASGFSRIVVDVQSGQRPTLPDEAKRCANMRAVMWSRMREWLRTADLPMDQELMEELCAPKYKFERKTDRMLVESKAEMLQRGVKSPNKADALVYTFWESMPSLAGGSGYAEPDEV